MKKQAIALLTALCVAAGCTASAETVKHERVYVVVNHDGEVQTLLDNVHLENGDAQEILSDRSMLKDIVNVSGHETFTMDGEALTWQADGGSIIYQGTSDKLPDIVPHVIFTLDGRDATAEEIKNAQGVVTMDVSFTMEKNIPYLALTLMPIDDKTLTDVSVENGKVFSDGNRTLLLGWAVPGMDADAELPAHFTMTATADHADLSWMMTFATSDPIDWLCDAADEKIGDLSDNVNELRAGLTALCDGSDLPEGEGKLHDGLSALFTLYDGVAELNDGAKALSDGAKNLDDGAGELETGLVTLVSNNDALNQGVVQLFDAVLKTANQQLAAAGLDAAGITVPELTSENYAEVLDATLAQLNPETLLETAKETAREKVKAEVMKQEKAVREAVSQAVKAQVLEGVLAQSGLSMTAQDYSKAVEAGQVTREQAQKINAAVEQMMGSDDVKAKLEAAVSEQIDALVEQNLADESVQKQLEEAVAPAKAGYEALNSLKTQLDSVYAFVTGLNSYTDGVSKAAEGAAALHEGSTQLSDGAVQLSDGTAQLADGLDELKQTLSDDVLPLLNGDVQKALDAFENTKEQFASEVSFDLVDEGMEHDMVYIIRTDLNK